MTFRRVRMLSPLRTFTRHPQWARRLGPGNGSESAEAEATPTKSQLLWCVGLKPPRLCHSLTCSVIYLAESYAFICVRRILHGLWHSKNVNGARPNAIGSGSPSLAFAEFIRRV